jgi:putative transposase
LFTSSSAFDTDLTDEQWATLAPFIPKAKTGGRPRKTDMRAVVNAILFLVKSGCHWRTIDPIPHFPPWETVYGYFRDWRRKSVWKKIHYHLYERVRGEIEKREPQPSAIVIDTQSIKTTKMAAIKSRGFDGGKRVKGRKRVLVTDTLGLLVDVSVVPANTHDTKAGERVLTKVAKRYKKKKTIQTVFADKGFQGPNLASWVKAKLGAVMQIGENMTSKVTGFVPAKKRWVVERTNAWNLDYRRLVVDHERLLKNSMTMIRIAFIRICLRRLYPVTRPPGDW